MNFWLKKCAMEVIKYAICLCFIVSCKNSNNINTSKNHISIKTNGGKAHTFTEMPGFFVELVYGNFDDNIASSEQTITSLNLELTLSETTVELSKNNSFLLANCKQYIIKNLLQ